MVVLPKASQFQENPTEDVIVRTRMSVVILLLQIRTINLRN